MPLIVFLFPLFKKVEEYATPSDYAKHKMYATLTLVTFHVIPLGIFWGIAASRGCLVIGLFSGILASLAIDALIIFGFAMFRALRFILSNGYLEKDQKESRRLAGRKLNLWATRSRPLFPSRDNLSRNGNRFVTLTTSKQARLRSCGASADEGRKNDQ